MKALLFVDSQGLVFRYINGDGLMFNVKPTEENQSLLELKFGNYFHVILRNSMLINTDFYDFASLLFELESLRYSKKMITDRSKENVQKVFEVENCENKNPSEKAIFCVLAEIITKSQKIQNDFRHDYNLLYAETNQAELTVEARQRFEALNNQKSNEMTDLGKEF